jgi:hypothetical protein
MLALARRDAGSYGAGRTDQIRELLMAKKARRTSAARRKTPAKGKSPKHRPMTIGEEFIAAYRVMRDTVRGTGRMRRKMERPGTDETE